VDWIWAINRSVVYCSTIVNDEKLKVSDKLFIFAHKKIKWLLGSVAAGDPRP